MRNRVKSLVKRGVAALGYTCRHMGTGVAGVDLLHDARALIGKASGAVLFDVGANVGQTAHAMLEDFRNPRVFAFEPSPLTFELLGRAVSFAPGLTLERIALGDCEGTLPFYVTGDYSVNDSLLAPTWKAGGSQVDVRVDTVDGYCRRVGIESIDLLKIDAQGYDLRVLHGARTMLARRQIRLYSCEANFERMYEGQATLRDLLAFADEVGYRLIGFYEQTYVKDRLSYLDALFANR